MLIDSLLRSIQLKGIVGTQKDRYTRRHPSVFSVNLPADCTSDEFKDDFFKKSFNLIQNSKRCVVVTVVRVNNAPVGKLNTTESQLDGSHSVASQRTCSDRMLHP